MSTLPATTSNLPIFTEAEQAVWQALITSESPSTEAIPEDLSAENVWLYLNVVTKGLSRAQQAVSRLKPFLGRILMLVRQHKHLYEQQGYTTFSEFITRGVPELFNISRPEAWNCIKVAEQLNFLPADKMEQMGFSKLNLLATALKRGTQDGMSVEMVKTKRDYWVAAAESPSMTVKQFAEKIETEMQGDKGELSTKALMIYVPEDVWNRWHEFVGLAEVQAYCDSESEGVILARLIDECETEWVAKAHDAQRGQ